MHRNTWQKLWQNPVHCVYVQAAATEQEQAEQVNLQAGRLEAADLRAPTQHSKA